MAESFIFMGLNSYTHKAVLQRRTSRTLQNIFWYILYNTLLKRKCVLKVCSSRWTINIQMDLNVLLFLPCSLPLTLFPLVWIPDYQTVIMEMYAISNYLLLCFPLPTVIWNWDWCFWHTPPLPPQKTTSKQTNPMNLKTSLLHPRVCIFIFFLRFPLFKSDSKWNYHNIFSCAFLWCNYFVIWFTFYRSALTWN